MIIPSFPQDLCLSGPSPWKSCAGGATAYEDKGARAACLKKSCAAEPHDPSWVCTPVCASKVRTCAHLRVLVCVLACVRACVRKGGRAGSHTRLHTCLHACPDICLQICTHMPSHMSVHMSVHRSTHMSVHTVICAHRQMHTHVRVQVYEGTRVQVRLHVYRCTCMHTMSMRTCLWHTLVYGTHMSTAHTCCSTNTGHFVCGHNYIDL